MTDKIQKATKVKFKSEESLTKQSIFLEYSLSSLEETFEFCWSLLADEHNTSPKIDQKTQNWTNLYLELHDYQIHYVTIDLRHQYGIPVAESQTFLLAKHPQR